MFCQEDKKAGKLTFINESKDMNALGHDEVVRSNNAFNFK